ncbi:MAG: hypothetical protein ACI4IW_07155 [Oscillospiraceae bacterium]
MSACTFFGSSECPGSVYPCLAAVIEELIATEHVTTFYVGTRAILTSWPKGRSMSSCRNTP